MPDGVTLPGIAFLASCPHVHRYGGAWPAAVSALLFYRKRGVRLRDIEFISFLQK